MKKNTPLEIWERLQPLVDQNKEYIMAIPDNGSMFHVKDRDIKSSFFFKIVRQQSVNGRTSYYAEIAPRSTSSIEKHTTLGPPEHITEVFKQWIEIIKTYNSIQTVYDDPIIQANQARFEKQFEILDDDAETSSFNLDQQIFLNDYLDSAKTKIEALKDGRTTEEVNQLEDLKNEATEIQKLLTKETKNKIIKKLARFWAKAQKIGLDVIKEVIKDVAVEFTKKILTGGL